jgi:mono/diheme cytochrome c family protein
MVRNLFFERFRNLSAHFVALRGGFFSMKKPRSGSGRAYSNCGIAVAALAVALLAGIGYANESASRKVVIPIRRTPATSGKQMYVNYCAPCHGVDGKGQGPVAAALKKQPANLAFLAKNNGGKFPSTHIMSVLEFGAANPSHGSADMPVWGPVFGSMDSTDVPQDMKVLRISNLSGYLQTLQAK